ncbi:TPA: hypothetical protein DCL89_00860 [candidate division WWE3 bacterium]|nr:hypothetical protein [candidate division WWE3 bacterium]
MSKATPYLLAASLSIILVLGVFRIFNINPTLPLNYTGDAIVHYNFAKNIEETGRWATNPRFGAPTGQTLYDFPLTETVHLLLIKLFIMLGLNWYESVNAFFILSFPMISLVSLFVMKRLGLKTHTALPLSIVYAFLPYHFLRGVNHLFLAGYFVVPLAMYVAYRFASNNPSKWPETVVIALLIASSGAYYTFISFFFVTLGGLLALFKKWNKKLLISLVGFLALSSFFFFINYLPTLAYTQKYGMNLNTTVRLASDTETYGLKITQLVLPFEDHNLSIFNKIQKRYMNYGSAVTNENQYAALGLTATFGFIFLILWAIFKHGLLKIEKTSETKLDILGLFNLAAVLFATVGGFAVIISTYVNPTFRSMNRISVFIAFISLVALGLIIERINSQKFASLAAWAILPIALFDQVSLGVMQNFMRGAEEYRQLIKYAAEIENVAGENAKIYTLPLGQYPEGVDKKLMRVALLTDTVTWSAGAEKWRAANFWQHGIDQLETKDFLKKIVSEGFTGLLIATKELDSSEVASIEKELVLNPLQDSKKEYNYYNLKTYATSNKIFYDPTDVFFHISGNCLYDQVSFFYCVRSGRVEFENLSTVTQTKTLILTFEFPDGKIEEINKTIQIPPGKSNYPLIKDSGKNVFPIPRSIPVWPVNIGYPTFIIREIELQ